MSLISDVMDGLNLDNIPTVQPTESTNYHNILASAAERHGISDKLPLLQKMLQVESGGKVNARSPKGASGLMQLMPGTARALGVKNIFDPAENIDAGVRYFKNQLDTFGDDALALAAYNSGPGAVKKYNGIPPFKETQKYVKNILTGESKPTPTELSPIFNNTISQIKQGNVFYGSGRQKKVFGDEWQADCCGGFTTTMINRGLRAAGVGENELLPKSNLGTGQPKYLAQKFGSELVTNFTPEKLASLGEGTVIAGTKPEGGTHAEMIVKHPATGNLVVASYGIKGKTVQYKDITDDYAKRLNSGKFYATNPFSVINPTAQSSSMVADVTGQTVPTQVKNPQSPEKERTISGILGDLANKLGPAEATAAEPPSFKSSLVDEIMQDMKPAEKQIVPGGGSPKTEIEVKVGDDNIKLRLPIAQQDNPPSVDTLAKVGAVDDPEAKIKLFAEARFPNEPEAYKRYFIKDGNVFYVDGHTIKREVPKETLEKLKEFGAETVLGRLPENVGGAVGFAAGGIPGAMAGAAFGSAVRQQFAKDFLGDKPKGVVGEGLTIAGEAAMAGVGGAIGKGMTSGGNMILEKSARAGVLGKLENRFRGQVTLDEIHKWLPLFNKYDMRYTVADITNSPTLQGMIHMISEVPGPAREKVAQWQRLIRVPDIDKAIQYELGSIAPEVSILEAGQVAQGAAKGVEAKLIAERKALASPFYETAKRTAAPVDTQPVIDKIDSMLMEFAPGGAEHRQLTAIKNLLFDKDNPLTDLTRLHSARKNINEYINSKYDPSLPATKNLINREATEIKKELSRVMYQASPEFEQADMAFYRLSEPINKYLYGSPNRPVNGKPNTLIQSIGKIENEEQLEKVPEKILKSTPLSITNMRRWFIDNGYDAEWNTLVRGMLQSRLEGIKTSVDQSGPALYETIDPLHGAKFAKAAFGDINIRRKLQAALTQDQFTSLRDFFQLMEHTGKLVYSNSKTTPMSKLIDEVLRTPVALQDYPVSLYRKYSDIVQIITGNSKVADRYEASRLMDKADVIWEKILDPDMAFRLAELKKISNSKERAIKFTTTILGLTTKHAKEGPKEYEPKK